MIEFMKMFDGKKVPRPNKLASMSDSTDQSKNSEKPWKERMIEFMKMLDEKKVPRPETIDYEYGRLEWPSGVAVRFDMGSGCGVGRNGHYNAYGVHSLHEAVDCVAKNYNLPQWVAFKDFK